MRLKRLSGLIFFWSLPIWIQWICFVIATGIVFWFNLVVFPSYALDAQNQVFTILDVRLFYTAVDVQNLFSALGQAGRQAYSSQLLADMVYPIAYSLLLHCLYVRFCLPEQAGGMNLLLAFTPYGALFADLAENLLILLMLAHYPFISPSTALLASVASSLKWFLIAIAVGLLLWCSLRKSKKFLLPAGAK